jgi:2-isopropylmalate synthase
MMNDRRVELFDSTLRDGVQGEGISYSVSDKLRIAALLDSLEFDYIEAGNPGSNPKDMMFFQEIEKRKLQHATLVAFGSTRRRGTDVCQDANIKSLLASGTSCLCIFGKSWDFQVTDIIRTRLEENLDMIGDTISYLVAQGREVFFDAEHFFDGYVANRDYALATLERARTAGASRLILCETRGGMMPDKVGRITGEVAKAFPDVRIGIHAHDDCGVAVAASLMAVQAGATQVQGTLLGFGERCGNANLVTVASDLKFKMGYSCLSNKSYPKFFETCREVAEISNIRIPHQQAFIGHSAFSHKGGMHIDGVRKNPVSFEHEKPESFGNCRHLLTSEVAGKALLLQKIKAIVPGFDKQDPRVEELVVSLKRLEAAGYHYEGAEASFDLIIRKSLGLDKSYFRLVHYKTIGEQVNGNNDDRQMHTAVIKVICAGRSAITAEEGAGPVNALDKALRKVLEPFYPQLSGVHLSDYKVRVLDGVEATASKVRVLIESTDGTRSWNTVGVSHDIIIASWQALSDSISWYLQTTGAEPAMIGEE